MRIIWIIAADRHHAVKVRGQTVVLIRVLRPRYPGRDNARLPPCHCPLEHGFLSFGRFNIFSIGFSRALGFDVHNETLTR